MVAGTSRGRELGNLLRSRRDRLQPADVCLPPGSRRRTRGLRREEVAALAAISPTYYTFLEQGRELHPSRQVLDSLASALHLTAAERAHLHQLAYDGPPAPAPPIVESLAPGLAELVTRLDPCPTYVAGRRWDVLAANRAARVLWTDWSALPPAERNMVWWTFTHRAARSVLVDWEHEASALLARLRSAAARHPDDPDFTELIKRLRSASPEVRAWWPRHEVAQIGSGVKRLRHPELGELTMRHVVLTAADDPDQKVVTCTADYADLSRIRTLVRSSRLPASSLLAR
ncbi:MAG TPA: helix-turn-helix transcriptional regulator [Pseudonocardiaceae bacterium]|nr:helix-turn-helix transcriptional regulator [Pseudonocardiaceae bacterium]